MVRWVRAIPGFQALSVGGRAGVSSASDQAAQAAQATRLADGAAVTLRAARVGASDAVVDGDADALRAMFYTLSDTTRYLYFCVGAPRNEIWAERVARLGEQRGPASYALVVEVEGVVVGVARFDCDTRDPARSLSALDGSRPAVSRARAEIGILLADAWQSRGLGRAVVARLCHEAQRRQIAGFTATVLGENQRALRLLRGAFPTLRARWDCGQYTLDMPFV